MALQLVTPPAVEPVELAEMKMHLRVEHSAEDALILVLIQAAREWCEEFTSRSFITRTWELRLDAWPEERYIELPRPPLQGVTWVKYVDENGVEHTLDASTYVVDAVSVPGRVVLVNNASWPSVALFPAGAVRVRYTAGYGSNPSDVPEMARHAVRLLAAHWYENRENSSPAQLREIPMAAEMLLWPLRVKVVG